jgi:hypothetical protein
MFAAEHRRLVGGAASVPRLLASFGKGSETFGGVWANAG